MVNAAVGARLARSARSCSTTRSAGSTPPRWRWPRARARGSCGCRRSAPPGEFAKVERADPDGNVPVWVRFELELRAAGARAAAGAGPRRATARRCPSCSRCCGVVARHGLVLATGHLSRDEIFAVVDAAVAAGVETIVVTNPEFPSHKLSPADQVGAGRARRAVAARAHDALHRQVHVGRDLRRHARRGRARTRSGAATSGRCSTRRSRTGWPSWPTASSTPASARRRSGSWRSRTRGGWPVPKRVQVIGAHSADFVWRAGGAVAKAVALGGVAEVIALSYGERGESGELWKQEGQTIENVKRIRHAEAEAAAAHLGASFRCLDFGDYPLQIDGDAAAGDRRRDPRVRARRADHPHRHRPVQPRPSRRLRRGRPRALARPRAPACRARSRRSSRRSCSCSSPTSPSCATSRPTVHVDITSVWEQKVAAMGEMQAQQYLQTYYAQRGEQRGNHARRASGRVRGPLRRVVHARAAAGRGGAVSVNAELARLGAATVYEASGRQGLVDAEFRQLVPGSRACGPARIARCGQDDNLMVHAVMAALQPGEVLVLVMPEPRAGRAARRPARHPGAGARRRRGARRRGRARQRGARRDGPARVGALDPLARRDEGHRRRARRAGGRRRLRDPPGRPRRARRRRRDGRRRRARRRGARRRRSRARPRRPHKRAQLQAGALSYAARRTGRPCLSSRTSGRSSSSRPRFDESLAFFVDILGMDVEAAGRSVDLPARLGRLPALVGEAHRVSDTQRHGRARPARLEPGGAASDASPRSRPPASARAGRTATSAAVRRIASAIPTGTSSSSTTSASATTRPTHLPPGAQERPGPLHRPRLRDQAPRPRQPPRRRRARQPRVLRRHARLPALRAHRARRRLRGRRLDERDDRRPRADLHARRATAPTGACTTSRSGSTRARSACAPPTSGSTPASRSRPRRPSTRSRRASSSTASSPAATASRSPPAGASSTRPTSRSSSGPRPSGRRARRGASRRSSPSTPTARRPSSRPGDLPAARVDAQWSGTQGRRHASS